MNFDGSVRPTFSVGELSQQQAKNIPISEEIGVLRGSEIRLPIAHVREQ